MDKSAIQQIQDSAVIPELTDHLSRLPTLSPLVAAPDSVTLHDLEKHMPTASRFRLNYGTTSMADFIEYNTLHDLEGATCFIDADAMRAESIFDLGTVAEPGHKENRGLLELKKLAAYAAIRQVNGVAMGQKKAAEFIEDWADSCKGIVNKNGDKMEARAAAAALCDLTIEAAREVSSVVGDFGASMSGMERIEAKNQDKIPATMIFTTEPYNGLRVREIEVRIGLLTTEDKPKIVLRILRLEQLQEDIAGEFKDEILTSTEDLELKTFIGEVR
ncbi:MAG: DUF2303 family protein [Porticoccaceae bacterium]|nr:DUF2303 family protein [Porticoccaceae bacterium]